MMKKNNYSTYSKSNLNGTESQVNLDRTTALHSETSPGRSNSNLRSTDRFKFTTNLSSRPMTGKLRYNSTTTTSGLLLGRQGKRAEGVSSQ